MHGSISPDELTRIVEVRRQFEETLKDDGWTKKQITEAYNCVEQHWPLDRALAFVRKQRQNAQAAAALKLELKRQSFNKEFTDRGYNLEYGEELWPEIDHRGSVKELITRAIQHIDDRNKAAQYAPTHKELPSSEQPPGGGNTPTPQTSPPGAGTGAANSASGTAPPQPPGPGGGKGAGAPAQGAGSPPDYTDKELDELTRKGLEYYKFDDRKFPEPMGTDAFHGIAGEIVEIIAKQSEACREAILAQFLVGFGNILGRGAHKRQGAAHYLNEFTVLVGETSFGRKGTAWNAVEDLFEILDPGWLSNRVSDGFQSGEAIVHDVRDPRVIINVRSKTNDPGVTDKRLQIFEDEFGRFLTAAARQGNTLSETARKAWDARRVLNTKGKISPEKATGSHISLIGHITRLELLKSVQEIENKNGFSNRILWIATHRAKTVPEPLPVQWAKDHPQIIKSLEDIVVTFGQGQRRELAWSNDGRTDWCDFYNSLKGSSSGIIGSILARSVAHVLRLTMLYTVLDQSALMEPKHLKAAIAFWEYCVQSAQWVFGEKTGDKIADRIYWALQRESQGMSRQQIQEDVFSKHCSKVTLDAAFTALINADLVFMRLERTQQARKPCQRWFIKSP